MAGADLLRDDDVHRVIEDLVRTRVEAVPLAPLAGRALRFFTQDGRHAELLDAMLAGLDRYLAAHGQELRAQLGAKSPWWLPGAVEDRIFDRLLDGARTVLREMAADRDHDLRRQFDARLRLLAAELETSVDLHERGERLKHDLLAQPQVRDWVASVWADAKGELRSQACDPESQLRRQLVQRHRGAPAAGSRTTPTWRPRCRPRSSGASATWPTTSTVTSPPSSAAPSPAGTPRRPPPASSSCSAPTSSTSGSTARSWAPSPAWPSTRVSAALS